MALIDSTIVSFDETAITAYADQVCRISLDAYLPPSNERNLQFVYFMPSEDSWNQAIDPDRVVTCLLYDADGG